MNKEKEDIIKKIYEIMGNYPPTLLMRQFFQEVKMALLEDEE